MTQYYLTFDFVAKRKTIPCTLWLNINPFWLCSYWKRLCEKQKHSISPPLNF